MRKPARGYARVDRVKEQIMRELAELVRTGLKDPRAGFITINDVEVTRAVADKLGVKVDFKETQWDAMLAGLKAGRCTSVPK